MALEADAIRFVLFDSLSAPTNALALWQTAFGGMPSGFQQPQQPGAPALANGDVGGNQVLIDCGFR